MTYYGATFWVGANAVIRKGALEDIVEVEDVGGFEIRTYIQDRTVIEDTESSVDLGRDGWTLVNYPERLSYSATPPDFGSLVVQRRRWANGGLLILPKLWDQLSQSRRTDATDPGARGPAARQLHGVHRLGELRPAFPAGLPLRQPAAEPAGLRRRPCRTSWPWAATCATAATASATSSGSTGSTSCCCR